MRLHRLEVEGFGPFRERQGVDFDAFADDGIFLIAGRTGAGKSSILDAICFGLYGGVPRYDGGEKRLRSDHCAPDDPSEVVVEFSTPAGRFRVTRSPEYERPKKRGGGMTTQVASVALDEWTDAGWVGRAARAVDVGNELEEILQLSREQFLQVILLAQNRFSEFLLANSKDRQALLRRLFGTERFEVVQSRFDERRRTAEQELGAWLATVASRIEEAERLVERSPFRGEVIPAEEEISSGGESPDREPRDADAAGAPAASDEKSGREATTEERLDDLRRAEARARYRVERSASEREDAEKRSVAADAALAVAREEHRAQQERDRARAAMRRLDADEPSIAEARAELERARAAESLRATVSAATRARAALAGAAADEHEARETWTGLGIEITGAHNGVDAAVIQAWVAETTKETGAWERAARLEEGMPALDAERQRAREHLDAAAARIEAGKNEREALPGEAARLAAERDEARRLADRSADLHTAQENAQARATAAHEALRLAAAEVAAEGELAEATAVNAAAHLALARLRQRRSDGMAGELASALVAAVACPVCGSPEHPAPAEHADPVSADDVAAADAVRDEAAQGERRAAEKLSALRAQRAMATGRADGRDPERAEAELAVASEEHARSLAAADTVQMLAIQLDELAARIERLDAERADADAAHTAAREELVLLEQRRSEAATLIADARGTFETVAERLAHAEGHVAAARALAEAIAERQRRESAAAEADAEEGAAVQASVFDTAAGVERALRPSTVQEALGARITEHAVQREKERAILFDLELRTLPEEPIDLAPAEQASVDARSVWTAAVDEASRAAATAERLSELIESAAIAHAHSAARAADFDVLRGLADVFAGRGPNTRRMTLETFVLAAELEEIAEAANRRLDDMSAGRYQLRHSDALAARGAASGLGIVVFDAFTGQARPAQSLSGGETFLCSLALALGLAEVVTARAGGVRLDTLFIDEGFGSLDGDTLDVAMRTLDELRQGGRTVGVISHVETMQEQIPAQLSVRATADGPSVIETR